MGRYIFSKEIPESIDKSWAATDLTSTLLTYLGSVVFDTELEDQEVEEDILKGTYRLFEYANFFWARLFNETSSGKENSNRLGALLEKIIQVGTNYSFQGGQQGPIPPMKNQDLKILMPDVFYVLHETFRFQLMDERWEWNQDNSKYSNFISENTFNLTSGDVWVNNDPLMTSKTLVRIRARHEELAVEPSHQARLQSHYGSGLFRCTFPFCAQSYRGFEAMHDRDEHVKLHGKLWKCPISNCPFGPIGFSTKGALDDHWMSRHVLDSAKLTAGLSDPDSLDVAEAQPILFLLVAENSVALAKRLLASKAGRQLKEEVLSSVRQAAAKRGSLELTQLLAPPKEVYMPYQIVVAAVRSQDITFAKEAISKAKPGEYAKLMKALISTDSEEIYALWEEHIISVPRVSPISEYHRAPNLSEQLFKGHLFTAAKGKLLKEARVRRAMRILSHHMTPSLLGTLLVRVAKSSCSVPLAQELLDLGAPVDYPVGYGTSGMTALHVAAKKTSEEAAFFMQYLIEQGAAGLEKRYPHTHSPTRIAAERGATNVVKYVGLTFEEMRNHSLHTRNVTLIEVD